MKTAIKYLIFFLCLTLGKATYAQPRMGAEQTEVYLPLLKGKRVALVVNHTSVVAGTHLADTLMASGVKLTTLFAPEHGIRGNADAGETVSNGRDIRTNLPIYSLYGTHKKPTNAQLEKTDIVVFDIQDVGARFYTYISTLYYVMQACAQYGKEVMVLDRPNPCDYIAGPIRERRFKSFVGMLPIPILHGCTVGELAQMINGEHWLGDSLKCKLQVVTVKDWKHHQPYSLPIKPSPNLPDDKSIACYASLCPFEGTAVSVGRGTYHPFSRIGSPVLKNQSKTLLTAFPETDTISFTPIPLEGWDKHPMHHGKTCYGISFTKDTPCGFTLRYVCGIYKMYAKKGLGNTFFSRSQTFDLLMGTDKVRKSMMQGVDYREIEATWAKQLEAYRQIRLKYLLYSE